MSTWELHGWGRQPWSTLVRIATNLTCAWADYGGFHVGPCPTSAPPYTHLWGWSKDGTVLLRARIDGEEAIIGVLASEVLDARLPKPSLSEAATVEETPARAWPDHHGRIAAQEPGVLSPTLKLVTALGPQPVSFVWDQTGT